MASELIFVSGIGTEVGKTIASAVLVQAMGADYWKPVQAGNLDELDRAKVCELTACPESVFHPERFLLKTPSSPHLAAKIDGIEMNLSDFQIPQTNNKLIIEGAGGLMVPLNEDTLMIDLIKHIGAKVVLVSKHYLGSINHTLMSAKILNEYNIPVLGILFNGEESLESERIILKLSGLKNLGHIPMMIPLDKNSIQLASVSLKVAG